MRSMAAEHLGHAASAARRRPPCAPRPPARATSAPCGAPRAASRPRSGPWRARGSVAPAALQAALGAVELVLGGRAAGVGLDHQHRARRPGRGPGAAASSTARMVKRVHQLEGHRHDARRGDAGDRVARRRRRWRRRPAASASAAGSGQQAQGRLGDDAERPLRADEQVRQVVARDVLDGPAAGPDDACRRRARPPGPARQSRVTPYFTQRRPPEFSARLPPMVQISKLAGSGA